MPAEGWKLLLSELGATGTSVWNDQIEEEYLDELRWPEAGAVYDQMRRSDAQVKMALKAMKLPILQCVATIEPSEDDPEKGKQIAKFVSKELLENNSQPWRKILSHALLMLDFGFSLMEKVWEIQDLPEALQDTGAPPVIYHLKKLSPRLPQTVYSWNGLDQGQLEGVTQRFWAGGKMQEYDIPLSKLVIFTNEKEGDNWEGISILRSAYKDWFIKDHLEKINAMIHERQGMGTPVWKLDESIDPTTEEGKAIIEACEDIAENLQANERAYVIEMPGTTFRYETPSNGNSGTVLETIKHHGSNVLVSMILQFMQLGLGESGSRAVAFEQRGPFDMALLAVAEDIQETFDRYVIREMVELNFGPRPGYPKLVLSKISEKDLAPLINMVSTLITAQALVADNDLEDFFRKLLNLPPANAEERERQAALAAAEAMGAFGGIQEVEPYEIEPVDGTPESEEQKDLEQLKQEAGERLSLMSEEPGHPIDWSYLLHQVGPDGSLVHAPLYDSLGNRFVLEHFKEADGTLRHIVKDLDTNQEVFWSKEEARAVIPVEDPLVIRQL